MADDPYVLARATLTGPIYGGQLHATPINDIDTPLSLLQMWPCACSPQSFQGGISSIKW